MDIGNKINITEGFMFSYNEAINNDWMKREELRSVSNEMFLVLETIEKNLDHWRMD